MHNKFTCSALLKYAEVSQLRDFSASSCYFGVTDSDKLRHDQKCKNMKRSQDMQLIQKLRNDQKRMKKVLKSWNIVTNSRVTPSWREIVSLTFSEAGVLHVASDDLRDALSVIYLLFAHSSLMLSGASAIITNQRFELNHLAIYMKKCRKDGFVDNLASIFLSGTGVLVLERHDSDDALNTLFIAFGVLATLNLDFATIEVAPKFLDFAATGVVNKALLTLEFLDKA
ncbi:hypothetical protein Tco_0265407 [Tanacetum coccineum]